ncbi:MAG: HAD family hydrolase [Herminiimonas sp.]|nr:HAD family hydrolase [Herminiimonas sp.]
MNYWPPVKAVLFDLDDTLWSIVPVIRRAEKLLHDWLTVHVPAVAEQWSIDSLRARRSILMQENPHFQIDLWALRHAGLTEAFIACNADTDMITHAMAVFSAARNDVTPFDDVMPSLQRLARRVALGSISNGFADLGQIGLAPLFQVSLAAHSFGSAKPDPALFHAACDALGIAPAESVYVGDDLQLDVVGAQAAGMRAVWMNRFDRHLPSEVRPDAVCTDLHALECWLQQLAA